MSDTASWPMHYRMGCSSYARSLLLHTLHLSHSHLVPWMLDRPFLSQWSAHTAATIVRLRQIVFPTNKFQTSIDTWIVWLQAAARPQGKYQRTCSRPRPKRLMPRPLHWPHHCRLHQQAPAEWRPHLLSRQLLHGLQRLRERLQQQLLQGHRWQLPRPP